MLSEGAVAPAVSLPAYADGERRRIDLSDYLGEGIVVLAFYPADFNPACSMQSSDLDDLDLFTMQKDVSVFGISPDSTYSHEAFAERYGLHIPLLSDDEGAAAEAYDLALSTDTGESLVQRAVFVVDHHGVVQFTWATDDLDREIDVTPVKQAVGDIGGDDTAIERYRVGYEHYAEGREAFTEAMAEYEDREWMDAHNEFERAEPAFTTAADHFDTAVRFAETADFETVVDRAEEKADTLSHAASWLVDSADAFASGRGKQGDQYREDAQRLLDAASELSEPPDPNAFTLTDDGIELDDSVVVDPDEDDGYAWQAHSEDAVDTDLGVDDDDLDAAVAGAGTEYDDQRDDGDTVEGDLEMDLDAVEEATAAASADEESDDADTADADAVDGDLEMNLDAVEEASATDAGGPADEDLAGNSASQQQGGATEAAEDAAVARGGSDENSDGSVDQTGEPGDERAESSDVGAEADADAAAPDGEAVDEEHDVEELELVDPTEGDDDEEDDERADWDIPGR